MNTSTPRTEIADGVYFSAVTDSRFKLNLIRVFFMAPLSEENNAAYTLFPAVISKSNVNFTDYTKLNNKLSSLYSATLHDYSDAMGDTHTFGISAMMIDNAFALENEKIIEEMTEILVDCLFNPVLENGVFPESTVELEKQTAIDSIEAELNDKIVYARIKACETIYKGEPAALHPFGTVEQMKDITPESLYRAYKNALENCRVEIVCAGSNDFAGVKEKFAEAFSSVKRNYTDNISSDFSKLKESVSEVTEKYPVSQSKLVMGFKSDYKNEDAMTVMSMIYGGTTTSKLFMNVREKMSLCYYCSAGYRKLKGMMLVNSGVENANIEKAKCEIIKQLDDIKNGVFTDEDIEHAMVSAENGLKSSNDSLSSIITWQMQNIYNCRNITPQEKIERIRAVTREQIIEAAKSVSLDTVYVLTSDGKEIADE